MGGYAGPVTGDRRFRSRAGSGLIGLLLALLVIALLVVAFLRGGSPFTESDVDGKTPIERIDTSKVEACAANRGVLDRQLATARTMGTVEDGAPLRPDLLRGARCPEGGTYVVDGRHVRCTVHGRGR